MRPFNDIDDPRWSSAIRRDRLSRGLSIVVILALSALCWAVLNAIVRAVLQQVGAHQSGFRASDRSDVREVDAAAIRQSPVGKTRS